jgi:tRNA-2-methylthio-N6-dimethylallyladenosine synthase
MNGCDNFCAYCVVPFLRGRETSRDMESILEEASDLISRGSREITLLGQNVNSFGRKGHRGGEDFVTLLERISGLKGLKRLRFTTSHPKDFPASLVALFRDLPNLCEQLHLPMQSGSDRILAAMGRKYDRERYLGIIGSLRAACPDIALSTDVIVGFPGETEKEFLETAEILERIRFDSIFSFKYSDRPMTAANRMEEKIPEEEKTRRLAHVQALQKDISMEISSNLIGRTLEVLTEGFGRKPGQLMGRARNLRIVNFDGKPELMGETVPVTITEAWPASLIGVLAG